MKFSKKSSPIKSVNIFGIYRLYTSKQWHIGFNLKFQSFYIFAILDYRPLSQWRSNLIFFCLILIRLFNLAAMGKIQKNI